MKPFAAALCLLSSLLLLGCSPQNGRTDVRERVLMHTSFEDLEAGAGVPQPSLTTAKAHTGKVSMFVDKSHPYSATYRKDLGALCDHLPRMFTLSAWVWVASPDDEAVIVMAIVNPDDPDHPVFRKTFYMTPLGGSGKWKQIRQSAELPGDIHASNQLVLYLWHANAQSPVYTDDWQLTELW